jgi:hypothetical protein
LLQAEKMYDPTGLQLAVKREKDKSQPKPMSAENKAMQGQRQAEKAAMAAQFAGKGGKAAPVSSATGKSIKPGGGGSAGTSIIGSKQDWVALLNILKSGGREESGGLHSVDFGIGFSSSRILSKAAREQKKVREHQQAHQYVVTAVVIPHSRISYHTKSCRNNSDSR